MGFSQNAATPAAAARSSISAWVSVEVAMTTASTPSKARSRSTGSAWSIACREGDGLVRLQIGDGQVIDGGNVGEDAGVV